MGKPSLPAVLERAKLGFLAPNHFVLAVREEGRIEVAKVYTLVREPLELNQVVGAVDDSGFELTDGAHLRAHRAPRSPRRRTERVRALPLRHEAPTAQAAPGRVHGSCDGIAPRRASRLWSRRGYRRERPSGVRERAAVPEPKRS